MKAVVATFNQEKALVGAFSVITNFRMELFEALLSSHLQFPPPEQFLDVRPSSRRSVVSSGCGVETIFPYLPHPLVPSSLHYHKHTIMMNQATPTSSPTSRRSDDDDDDGVSWLSPNTRQHTR